MKLNKAKIEQHSKKLENHSLLTLNNIQSMNDLRVFMEHHVFAVWDFMSLLKCIQASVVPSTTPWVPTKGNRSNIARMVNEIVLCEESDVDLSGGSISHFDLYIQAMLEVGADVEPINKFLTAFHTGSPSAFNHIPEPSRKFVLHTLQTVEDGPHCAAASFAYGRETIIPTMFTKILRQLEISSIDAPKFHYYLQRHIEVDGDEHGPMSEYLVEFLCEDDPVKIYEAEKAATEAIDARVKLFSEIERLL